MPGKKNEKSAKKPKAKGLTKKQLQQVAKEVNARLKLSDVKASVTKKVLAERHIEKSKLRKGIFDKVCSDDLLSSLCDKFKTLFTSNSCGPFENRYAKFQLQWINYVSGTLQDHVTKDHPLADISSVIHAIANAVFDFMLCLTKQVKPSFSSQPVVPKAIEYDSKSCLMAFSGACMRLIYKKCRRSKKQEMCNLINNLKMNQRQIKRYLRWGFIPPELRGIWTLPVSPLMPYIHLLNRCIQENCTESAFSLYGKEFVKVCTIILKIYWGPGGAL